MKQLLLILALLFSGCDVAVDFGARAHERPTMNLPEELRVPNWLGNKLQGSCVWATSASLLRWQGRNDTATYLMSKYGNGEWSERFAQRCEAEGIRLVQTTDGSMGLIDWACSTRRGCGAVVRGGTHMIAVVYASESEIGILDPNEVDTITYVPRDIFKAEFEAAGGWSFAFVYVPAPPLKVD
jgi:hypothetical protein